MTSTNVLQALQRRRVTRPVLFPRDAYALPASVTSTGVEQRQAPESYSWDGRRRGSVAFCLFQYTLQGEGALAINDTVHSIRPGQAILLTIPGDHRYYLPAAGRWRFFYLCLNGAELMRAFHACTRAKGSIWTFEPSSLALLQAASLCRDLLSRKPPNRWETSARTYALAMALLAQACPHGPASAASSRRSRPVREALATGRVRFTDPQCGVDTLAEAAGLTRFHFTRLFKHEEGLPPGEWLRRQRLAEAVRRLQTTRVPIADIARLSGFTDPNYFSRAFRQAHGVTPQAFRDSGMF
ncbi:MAG: AraC family transcriptional regulator [Opitutales bacterium]